MKNLMLKQKGITFIGLCFILAFIGIVVMFVVRAFPLYNEKFQVTAAINSVVSRPDAAELTVEQVRDYFMRNIQVTNIERFTDDNIKNYLKIENPVKKGESKMIHVTFEGRNKLFADLYLVMVFDQRVPLRSGGTGE